MNAPSGALMFVVAFAVCLFALKSSLVDALVIAAFCGSITGLLCLVKE